MNTPFAINFRREAFQREVAKTRRRTMQLGLWVFYFGALGVVLGLYGLNAAALSHRLARVEKQLEHLRSRPAGNDWRLDVAEAAVVDRHLMDTRRWRARLERLPRILPPNAHLRALQFNPENASGSADVKLVLTGEIRGGGGQGRVQAVMAFVGALSRDSVFAADYRNIRLLTTRTNSAGDGAEFVVECR